MKNSTLQTANFYAELSYFDLNLVYVLWTNRTVKKSVPLFYQEIFIHVRVRYTISKPKGKI